MILSYVGNTDRYITKYYMRTYVDVTKQQIDILLI